MPLFRRSNAQPDGDLPLTVDQAATLRRLVHQAFAAHGTEVTMAPDHVEDSSGAKYGLWNLAALCNDNPQRSWPQLVSHHVANLLDPGSDIETLSDDELIDLVHLRIQSEFGDELPRTLDELAPGLATVLAVDLPTMVSTPQLEYWEERGGVGRWEQVGRRNLAALVGATGLEHLVLGEGEMRFHAIIGDSFFTASLALAMDETVRHYQPTANLSNGLLVAVPNRHQLVWRSIDGPEVVPSLNGIVHFTKLGYDDAAGGLSPHVYWRHEGRWEQLTAMDGDQVVVNVSPAFQAVLESLF